jgi:hypothetical protein
MWRKLRKQGSNWCCRIGLGLAIGTVLIVLASNNRCADRSYHYQALAAEEAPPYSEEMQIQVELERLAGEDPLGLLRLAQESYHKSVRDYTCTFIKQERINGHFKDPEKIRVYFKEAPFSVLMNWQEPKGPVDTLLYVEKDGNKTILVHPAGLAGLLVRTVRRDIDDPRLKKSSLRTPAGFGFGRVLDDMVSTYEEADKNGDLVIEYLHSKVLDGRECLVLRRKLPMDKGYDTLYAVLYIYLDKEYLLPTRTEGYDTAGNLISCYRYLDVRFNRGLTDQLFSPRANGLDG